MKDTHVYIIGSGMSGLASAFYLEKVDSLFMPRSIGDRADDILKGSTAFAFLGQFSEALKNNQ